MYHSQEIYSNADLIPVSQVLATAKLRLGLDNGDEDLWQHIEIENALMNFGSIGTVTVITKPVTIENRQIKLPRGIRRFIGIRHDWCLNGIPTVDPDTDQPNFPIFVFTRPFLLGYSDCGLFDNWYYLKDGYIDLKTDHFDGLSVSICYEGYNQDDYNNMRVYAVYESALAWKLCELYLLTNPFHYGEGREYIAERNAKTFQRKFVAEKNKIRADEQRTAWKNDAVKMAAIQDRVQIADYRLYWTY